VKLVHLVGFITKKRKCPFAHYKDTQGEGGLHSLLLNAGNRRTANCQDLFPVSLTTGQKTPWLYGRFTESRLGMSRGRYEF